MPLLLKFVGGLIGPVIVCDLCKEVITNAEEAIYMFEWDEEGKQDDKTRTMYFLHRGICLRAFEGGQYSSRYGWGPLENVGHFLKNNCAGIDQRDELEDALYGKKELQDMEKKLRRENRLKGLEFKVPEDAMFMKEGGKIRRIS